MSDDLIDVRLWRQFLAVAELLHFGRAAQRLHMTQPPLTMAIQQLERRLGQPLFVRNRRAVALAPAGAALLQPVRQWLAQGEALSALARGVGEGDVGRLRLGFVSTLGFGPLPDWLRGFRERYPRIEVELREVTTDVQRQAFAQSELDAGFMLHASGMDPGVENAGLDVLRVLEEPLVLALPEAHPLAKAARLSLPVLMAQPLVIFPRPIAPSLFDAVLAYYHRHGTAPVIAQEAIQMQTIVNLVSAGLGLAWVPASVRGFQRTGVVYREVAGGKGREVPGCETSLVWPAAARGPVLDRFIMFLQTQRP